MPEKGKENPVHLYESRLKQAAGYIVILYKLNAVTPLLLCMYFHFMLLLNIYKANIAPIIPLHLLNGYSYLLLRRVYYS